MFAKKCTLTSASTSSMQRQAGSAKSALQRLCRLDIDSAPGVATNTAVLCTVGPACANPEVLADMLEAGMGLVRLNLSHGTLEEHKKTLRLLGEAERLWAERSGGAVRPPLAVAVDTRGREIRTGPVDARAAADSDGQVTMATGSRVRVHCGAATAAAADVATAADRLWLSFAEFARLAKPGQVVHIDDGLLQLRVTEARPAEAAVDCVVEVGGPLGPRKSVCLPGLDTGLSDLAPRDLEDLAALAADPEASARVGIVMASFVSSAETVRRVRAAATGAGSAKAAPLVVAKIGDARGLRALDEIIAEADAVLIARGDLGSELPQQKVFVAQKCIIARCRVSGKASICATHLLDSMVTRPRPTRAEASDVANAVIDGVDCLMLSAETAIGKYPVEAVRMLAKICREAEAAQHASQQLSTLKRQLRGPANPLQGSAMAACEAAVRCHAAAIVVITDNARLPRLAAMCRPPCPILTASSDAALCRSLNLWYGVHPLHYDKPPDSDRTRETDRRIRFAAAYAHCRGLLTPTDLVVLLVAKSAANSSDLMTVVTAVRLLAIGSGKESDDGEFDQETTAQCKSECGNNRDDASSSTNSLLAENGLLI